MSNNDNDDLGLDSLPPAEPQGSDDQKTLGGVQGGALDLEEPSAQEVNASPEEPLLPATPQDDDYQPELINEHVTMAGPAPFLKHKNPPRNQSMVMLNSDLKDLEHLLNTYNIDFTDEWAETATPEQLRLQQIAGGLMGKISLHYFENIVRRDGSTWAQVVPTPEGDEIRAGLPGIGEKEPVSLKVGSATGTQRLVQIPLWHSGIWVTLRSPSLSKLIELDERLSQEKGMLGRESNGLVFSSTEVYANYHITEFIHEHIHSCSLPNKRPELLKEIILSTDLSQLMWGMCVSMYPKGYPLSQPCLANPNKCAHVFDALLNLGKISWTDYSLLSTEQIRHMANRSKTMELSKVKEYQEAFVFKADRIIKLNENTSIRLSVPSIAESETSGFAWVDGIYKSTSAAFGVKLEGQARENYIQRQVKATTLRQYAHWIEAIIRVNEEGQEIVETDPGEIDTALEDLCIDEDLVDLITTGVLNYIDASTITLIAIPKQPCPKCGKEVDESKLRHPELIPLDIVNLFFTLRFLKTGS